MLELRNVTLVAVTDLAISDHAKALSRSSEGIKWGDIKLLTPELGSIDAWNHYIIYELHKHISTDFCMLIHSDGYVRSPERWQDSFLDYDYIGAPWPLPTDSYSYLSPDGTLVRVGNSVSLRSKKILELPSKLGLEWKSYYGNTNEDGFLCVHNRQTLIEHGVAFAPLDVAKYFSKEHDIPENQGIETFAFHTVDV